MENSIIEKGMVAALQRAVPLEQVLVPVVLDAIARMKEWPPDAAPDRAQELLGKINKVFGEM